MNKTNKNNKKNWRKCSTKHLQELKLSGRVKLQSPCALETPQEKRDHRPAPARSRLFSPFIGKKRGT
eukprot:6370824-Amphidinium_carterae.1